MTQASPTIHSLIHSITDLHSPNAKEGESSPSPRMKEREGLTVEQSNRLEVLVAEMKGQVLNELGNQRQELRGLAVKLDGVQTRREAEQDKAESIRRIMSLEDDRRWLVRHIMAIWFAGLLTAVGTIITFAKKVF